MTDGGSATHASTRARNRFSQQHGSANARGVMYIHQIAVAPEQRRSGVGSRLVQRVEECASELRLQTLALDSWMFNTEAHEFFRKLGFTEYRLDMWKTIDKSS